MDKMYAHMFEGKNRMFEVQVQGRFKKPPDGELFISLEITERMKLGLLTKVGTAAAAATTCETALPVFASAAP